MPSRPIYKIKSWGEHKTRFHVDLTDDGSSRLIVPAYDKNGLTIIIYLADQIKEGFTHSQCFVLLDNSVEVSFFDLDTEGKEAYWATAKFFEMSCNKLPQHPCAILNTKGVYLLAKSLRDRATKIPDDFPPKHIRLLDQLISKCEGEMKLGNPDGPANNN